MLDPKFIRTNLDQVVAGLKLRGVEFPRDHYEQLEQKRKTLQVDTEKFQQERKTLSKQIGQLKAKGEPTDEIMAKVAEFGDKLDATKEQYDAIQAELDLLLMGLPNLPQESVPAGRSEDDNVSIRTWGDKPQFDFEPKEHYELGESMQQMDFQLAAKLTGSRFVVLHRHIAKLQRALTQFMLDTHVNEHGYNEIYTPYIVNQDSLYGTGQLPKFAEDQFKIDSDNPLYLIPTAEVPVTNVVRDEIIDESSLPLKFVAHTPCFRSEAGSYGKDTKGMLRQHQFEKVELVTVCKAGESYDYHEQLTQHAETILQRLNLHYRVMNLCTGDIGFSSSKTYDLEVWLPGQDAYREISSCSNFEDFQARRLKARYRSSADKQTKLVHTLNGSGLAVGRTLIAIMENYQNADGSITVPEALLPYMDGMDVIR